MIENRCWLIAFALLAAAGGCSKSPFELVPVSGIVKYADGTIPDGAVRVVRFEPIADAEGNVSPRAAAGFLEPDGTFQLSTLRSRDGAIPGDYKPVLLFWKSPVTRESVVPPIYANAKTTPLSTISVKPSERNHFDLTIERSSAQ